MLHLSALLLVLVCCGWLNAQVDSRAAEIEAARDRKANHLEPEEVSRAEAWVGKYFSRGAVERLTIGGYGFSALMGGAATGQGFAIGPQYLRRDLFQGEGVFLADWQITTSGSTRGQVGFALPEFGGDRMALEIGARRHNYNRIDYYGPGPGSEKTGRSNYRYEDVAFDALFRMRLGRHFYFGPTAGAVFVNVGPGKNSQLISTDEQFTPEQAPGIDRQTKFFRAGGFAGFDWRDSPAGARAGGIYGAVYDFYDDFDLKRHDFHHLKLRAEQYFPFYNKRRIIALRADTDLTWRRYDQIVPFYLQPVVGGSESLRGYRPYRFYGDNSLRMTAEYRWEVFSGMDAAIFADAGKVFQHKKDLDLTGLESDVGFGFRFNVRNATFLRLDFGFSHEGFMMWVKFNDVFVKKPVGRSSPEHIFSGGVMPWR